MKRAAIPSAVAILVATAVGVMMPGRRTGDSAGRAVVAKADSVWYHASDVALLAKTRRPQLVEFFHPD